MKTCEWLINGHELCVKPCEGKYALCASHGRLARKQVEEVQRESQKRNTLIAKQREKNQAPRAKVNKISAKMIIKKADYVTKRFDFLDENPECEIKANEFCTGRATEIHHTAGRIGDNYLDVTKWKPACRSCHNYAHDHPKEAIEKGWSQSRLATTEPHKI